MYLLIVEDETNLAEVLSQMFQEQKYEVDVVYNGKDGLDYGLSGLYDVILLDVMLPLRNGFEVVHQLRRHGISTPVMLLTAKDSIGDKITGLDYGADDYLTKPFDTRELLARVRAMGRRQGNVVLETLSAGDLTLSVTDYALSCGDKCVQLGNKEFQVLQVLMANAKTVVSKELLITKIWGAESNAEDNNVEAYISFLRKKLQFLDSAVSITTLRKIGYRLGETRK